MIAETLMFAALVALFAVPLGYAFGPDDLAALRRLIRRWRLRRRLHQYTAAWHRDGVDLAFAFAQLRATRPDRRIRTLPRHRLAGGAR